MALKEDDIILCKVEKIEGTTVFLELEDGSVGTMVLSEVAAGRIRNLRNYVSPNKKIVCKILKIENGHIELSLRRVTGGERENVLEGYKKEKAFEKMIKIVGGVPGEVISKIKEKYNIVDFLEESREDVKVLEKFVGKEKAKKLFEMISEKEGREKIVEREFVLMSSSEQGVKDIKEILDCNDCEIHYLGSGKFSISVSSEDFKEANLKMDAALEDLEKRAKGKKALFEIGNVK
jgi:translation initiation factor 2 alpha subunit (eIF-2alpha)